jgi:hypothetical protein
MNEYESEITCCLTRYGVIKDVAHIIYEYLEGNVLTISYSPYGDERKIKVTFLILNCIKVANFGNKALVQVVDINIDCYWKKRMLHIVYLSVCDDKLSYQSLNATFIPLFACEGFYQNIRGECQRNFVLPTIETAGKQLLDSNFSCIRSIYHLGCGNNGIFFYLSEDEEKDFNRFLKRLPNSKDTCTAVLCKFSSFLFLSSF